MIQLPSFVASNNLKPYIEQGMQDGIQFVEYLDKTNIKEKGARSKVYDSISLFRFLNSLINCLTSALLWILSLL
jgi:hypothetical protein